MLHKLQEHRYIEWHRNNDRDNAIIVQHYFKPPWLLSELRGFVSSYEMETILKEAKRAKHRWVDVVTCGCVKHQTHRLPCAREILKYKRS